MATTDDQRERYYLAAISALRFRIDSPPSVTVRQEHYPYESALSFFVSEHSTLTLQRLDYDELVEAIVTYAGSVVSTVEASGSSYAEERDDAEELSRLLDELKRRADLGHEVDDG